MKNANLFFVHTPFQFFVAQNIIMQEKLSCNILLRGFVGNNKQFYASYNLMKIDDLWTKIYTLDSLPTYASVEKKSFLHDVKKLIRNDRIITQIINDNNVATIYLGDINNVSCRFAAMRYARKKINIAFYEEGSSHYAFQKIHSRGGIIINSIASAFLDLCVYLPRFHFFYAKYIFFKDLTFDKLPITTRYSIIPKFNENFDKQLHITNIISKNLDTYLKQDLDKISNQKNELVLFLSQPLDTIWGNEEIMLDVIKKYFSENEFSNKTIIVKFHPRETEDKKTKIQQIFQAIGLNIAILSSEYSLPVEIYLMRINFSQIVHFYTSTITYNGYIYPKTSIISILPEYIAECKNYGVNTAILEEIFNNVKQIYK